MFVSCLVLAAGVLTAQHSDSLRSAVLTRIAASDSATVAVSLLDMETGESMSINADTSFHAASTMKVPVMIEVLRRAQKGAFSLDQELLLVNEFSSLADGSLFSLVRSEDSDTALYSMVGQRVPVRDLMRRMITLSSNLATNQLIALVGAAAVTKGAREIGATRMKVLRGVQDIKAFDLGMNNTTTSSDLAILLAAIERGKVLSEASSAEMRNILLAQEFNSMIPAGVPPGTRVAHKTGEITAVNHDAAIVYPAGRKPYVLVVLTRGLRSEKSSSELIADISRLVWAHVMRATQ